MPKKKPENSANYENPIFSAFAMWVAAGPILAQEIPEFEGIKEQQDFAERFKVHKVTLSKWKDNDNFWQLVDSLRARVYKEKLGNAVAALYNRALREGAAAEVKLFAQLAGSFKDNENELRIPAEVSEAIKKISNLLPN